MKIVNKAFYKNTMLIKEQDMMDFFLTLPPFFFIFLIAAHFSNIATILLQGDQVCQQLSKQKKIYVYICLKFVFSLLKKKENSNISLSYGGIKLLWLRDSQFLQRVSWGQIEWILLEECCHQILLHLFNWNEKRNKISNEMTFKFAPTLHIFQRHILTT